MAVVILGTVWNNYDVVTDQDGEGDPDVIVQDDETTDVILGAYSDIQLATKRAQQFWKDRKVVQEYEEDYLGLVSHPFEGIYLYDAAEGSILCGEATLLGVISLVSGRFNKASVRPAKKAPKEKR